jgi:hypothetical protein
MGEQEGWMVCDGGPSDCLGRAGWGSEGPSMDVLVYKRSGKHQSDGCGEQGSDEGESCTEVELRMFSVLWVRTLKASQAAAQ